MKAIHVMADGTIRQSVKGVTVTNEQFYKTLATIVERKQKGDAA